MSFSADPKPGPYGAAPATSFEDSAAAEPRVAATPPVAKTGDARVDAALERLNDLDGVPMADHIEVYEAVHRDLQGAMSAIDQES